MTVDALGGLGTLLPQVAGTQLVGYVLVLARLGGLFAIGPIFSSRVIPARARSLAALALALALDPVATSGRTIPSNPVAVAAALAQEAAIGLAFAVAVAAVVAAIHAAAALADMMTGFGFGALVDPVSGGSGSAFGQLYALFATLIFVLTGGDRLLVEGLARSYAIAPLGAHLSLTAAAAQATDSLATIVVLALEIAAPVLVAIFLTDAAFGIVARAVPQMNILVVGLPAKILIAFSVTAAALPLVALHATDDLSSAILRGLEGLTR